MLEAALSIAAVAAVLAAPHRLALERATPALGALAWLATLSLRATLAAGAAFLALALIPSTGVFERVSQATVHEPLPVVPWHPDLSGDTVAHIAVVLPAGALALSLLAFLLVRLVYAVRLRKLLGLRSLGPGPGGALVVAEPLIVAGVPGIGRGRVVISHAALAALDPAELNAVLAHERAHLDRRHRPLQLLAGAFACVGRGVPGTRAAARHFKLCLERDADEFAVRATGDPLALASAICKAATVGPRLRGLVGISDGAASARVDELLSERRHRGSRAVDRRAAAVALALACANAGAIVALAGLVGERPDELLLAIACAG